MIAAQDGHITRGGEFEKRAAFVPVFSLPAGTVGLAAHQPELIVFSANLVTGMPLGVACQRLQNGPRQLFRVPSYDLYAGRVYAAAEFQDGTRAHFYGGALVDDWFDGRARTKFYVIDGTTGSQLTNLTVNSIPIINAPVPWAGSTTDMADAIAEAINSYTSNPDYVATSVNNKVNIIRSVPGASYNGLPVSATVSGGLSISPSSVDPLGGGSDEGSAYQPGLFVRTISSQMHSVSGPNEYFSGIKQPTVWTTDALGAGFIDMSSQESGSEELTALARYQQYVAVFAERVVQIWYFDPDPVNDKQSQVLNNTGTASPRSVTQFGDNDLFYLDESGLRSLRARDASNAAATTDIGVPVDMLITAKLRTLTQLEREAVIGLIEPRDGRFWLIMKDTIFVFSFFNGAKVSAWSIYKPTDSVTGLPIKITDAVVYNRRVYLRAGDKIYVYGGVTSTTAYDNTSAIAWLPYLDADAPARPKRLTGFDAAVRGTWQVSLSTDPENQAIDQKIAVISRSTFGAEHNPMEGSATHIGMRFASQGPGPAKLGSVLIHHDLDADEG